MGKGQFYLISITFSAIVIFSLLVIVNFVEFGPLTLEDFADFENLQNSAHQRNNWIKDYWYNLNWSTRALVKITGSITNPVEVDAGVPSGQECWRSVVVYNKTNGSFNYVPSNVSSHSGPCNVTFNASIGQYEIYWNASPIPSSTPLGRASFPATGNYPAYSKYVEQAPQEGICSHFSRLLPKRNIRFDCSGKAVEKAFNYSVNFTSINFQFSGNL